MKFFIMQGQRLLAGKFRITNKARRATLLLVTLLIPQSILAQEKYDTLYVMSSRAKPYLTFKETVEEHQNTSASSRNTQRFVAMDDLHTEKLRELINNSQTVVTLGQKSLRNVADLRIDRPHLATLITLEDYRDVLSEKNISQGMHCVLVIDQPLHRITRVIRERIPDARIAGIIAEPKDANNSKSSIAMQYEYDPIIARVPPRENIHSTIRTMSENGIDVIIALHNKEIYNRSTARNILISSYHFNLPLIGYSRAFVRAGALMGIYSTPESMADETLGIINQTERCVDGSILYPSRYTVEVNPQVAKSLRINIEYQNLKQTYQDRPRK
ncbi:hypothetical protein [Thiohalophilus sp.]|uniref:hypothetical protein n=1 Tax=Thiohalophilus sp. TaxID=3028392 RepID=UPI0039767D6D